MTIYDQLFTVASCHQSDLLRLLTDLEAAELTAEGGRLPGVADALKRRVWPFLQMYGRRDEHGSVDESIDEQPRAWRPGDDDDAAS